MALVDCRPAFFSTWWPLFWHDFCKCHVPTEIYFLDCSGFFFKSSNVNFLKDNMVFCTQIWKEFIDESDILICFVDISENGIVKTKSCQCQYRVAIKKPCSIPEVLYWYKLTPKDNVPLSIATVNKWWDLMCTRWE